MLNIQTVTASVNEGSCEFKTTFGRLKSNKNLPKRAISHSVEVKSVFIEGHFLLTVNSI
jgi:hypothetical protein